MNFSLSLRKQKLSNQLMQKREINKPIPKNPNLIEIHTLDLSNYVEQIETYNSITDPSKQIQFLIETIIKESNQCVITEKPILFYSNNETSYPTKDIIKFCLAKFISFLENTDLNENTKLVFPDEFVAVLIYESWISNDIRVRQCCLDILNEYSYNSEHLSEYVNKNTYAFGRFFEITYHTDINIVETDIIVFTNVLIETTDAVIKKVSQKFPLYLRGIELLTADLSKFDTKMVIEFKLSMIDFISQAIRGCNDINVGNNIINKYKYIIGRKR